jgi:hypothetical protein
MMGRQVNFFLSMEDQENMNSIILNHPETTVIECRMKSVDPVIRDSTRIEKMGGENLCLLLLRAPDLEKIIVKPATSNGFHYVDSIRSPVIEYDRCFVDPGHIRGRRMIRRGRFYFVPRYRDEEGCAVEKSPEFLKWATSLFGKAKKNLIYRKDDMEYYGEGALAAEGGGWELTAF